jgi:hypothetical protein
MVKKAFHWPLHPLLFAVGYVFIQFNLRSDIYSVSEIWTPLAVFTVLAGLLFLLIQCWKSDRHVAGVWASCWVVILTSLFSWTDVSSVFTLLLFWVLSSVVCVFGKRMAALGMAATRSFNVFAVLFLLAQASMGIADRYRIPTFLSLTMSKMSLATTPPIVNGLAPNVFHIVMDAYSRDDVLRTVYGFDNAPFLNTLKELGFYVFEDAHAPFNQTLLTMASVFSGAYLDQEMLQQQYRDTRQMRQTLGCFLDVGTVPLWLRRVGYHLSVATTGYHFIQAFHVDRWERPPNGETNLFAVALYDGSPMGWLDQRLFDNVAKHRLFGFSRGDSYLNDLVRFLLPLGAPSDLQVPYLVYRHILAPHPPLTLDHAGQDLTSDFFSSIADGDDAHRNAPELREAYIRGYVEKLKFANDKLLVGLKRIIKEAPHPFIIFLHGDHGGGAYLSHESMAQSCPKERFSILMAVYASNPELQHHLVNSLSQAPNPVNFYRALYNAVHDANQPLLPDQSQFATWSKPWAFTPVPPAALNTECIRR